MVHLINEGGDRMNKEDWLKIVKGDKKIFSEIIMEVKNDAYRIAYCYLHDENEAMDCVCNAIEKAFINIKKLKEGFLINDMIISSCFDMNLQLSVENCQNLFIVNCQLYFIIHIC